MQILHKNKENKEQNTLPSVQLTVGPSIVMTLFKDGAEIRKLTKRKEKLHTVVATPADADTLANDVFKQVKYHVTGNLRDASALAVTLEAAPDAEYKLADIRPATREEAKQYKQSINMKGI